MSYRMVHFKYKTNLEVINMYTEQHLTDDLLKIAGAAGLIGIAENEKLDLGIRKEASDRLDEISCLNPSFIGNELVKVAFELFSEDELTEVLAGTYLDNSFEKIANIVQLSELDDDSLEKIAAESGHPAAAAKAVAHELSDAASNVVAVIDQKKAEAESRPGGAIRSGGENVNNLEGYNPLLNPEEYDIEQTANYQIEQAMMVKQASYEAYLAADEVLRAHGY